MKVAFGRNLQSEPDERVRDAYTEGNFCTFAKVGAAKSLGFLFGSCNLHSLGIFKKPDRALIEISRVAKANNAHFMIHCGDQIYSDIDSEMGHMPAVDAYLAKQRELELQLKEQKVALEKLKVDIKQPYPPALPSDTEREEQGIKYVTQR